MLTYDFENTDKPLYQYLYDCIKSDILNGVLHPDEKLPSRRSFAAQNGISTITIQNTYDQLISEGYIYALPKRGYFVSKLDFMQHTPKHPSVSLDISFPSAPTYKADLSNNSLNPDNFPFSVWAKLSREVISNKQRELMTVSPPGGKPELKKAIAKHLKSFRGMLVDSDQIIIGAGTEYLYGLIIQLLGNDKIYCIENPGYKKLIKVYRQHGISCRFADIDEKGISAGALNACGTQIAHICPNHHFPTGISMPASRRYEILSWANETNPRYIIEDDYDSEFRVNGKPLPTLFSIDNNENVIYMNTFSKSLTPTIRISYMVLPAHLVKRFYETLSFYSCTVSNFEQLTLAEFITKGHFEKHINRMRLYYARQRKRVINAICKSSLNDKCEIYENDAGLHFLLQLKTSLSDTQIMDRLHENNIEMKALSAYYLTGRAKNEHMFIINYSNLESVDIENVFNTISTLLSTN